jgi:hypothetical protein
VTCPDNPSQLSPSSIDAMEESNSFSRQIGEVTLPARRARSFHVRPALVYCKRAVGPVLLQPPMQAEWLSGWHLCRKPTRANGGGQVCGSLCVGAPVREPVRSLGSLTAQSRSSNKEKTLEPDQDGKKPPPPEHPCYWARTMSGKARPQWPALAARGRRAVAGGGCRER